MKNILVPTNYDPDTIEALMMSSDLSNGDGVRVILLCPGVLPDSITEMLFPSEWKAVDEEKRGELFNMWISGHQQPDIKIVEHEQFGISKAVIEQVLERFKVDMAIVPYSLRQSKEVNNRMLLSFLVDSNLPLTLLPNQQETLVCS